MLDLTRPTATIVVTVADGSVRVTGDDPPTGALILAGTAVDLLEVLSIHTPFTHDVPSESAWLISGLSDVFESIA